jgi:hypothetical protein
MPAAAHDDVLREVIRRTVAPRAADDARADGFARTWAAVSKRLTRVIGERGVEVLLARAVRLTSVQYPWLAARAVEGEPVAHLQQILTERPVEERAEASVALFVSFTGLLTTLVGEPLCHRLLEPIWARPSEEPLP